MPCVVDAVLLVACLCLSSATRSLFSSGNDAVCHFFSRLFLCSLPIRLETNILRRRHVKKLPIPDTDNVHNSLAQDIINSLGCESLQNPTLMRNNDDGLDDDDEEQDAYNEKNNQRRLDQVTDDFEFN